MLSLYAGHDVGYLTGPVAGGRESYYTGAAAAGEPPGLWYGAGADELGLRGEVDADLMEAVYTHLLDPRDEAAHSRATWGQAQPLAKAHRTYRSAEDIYAEALGKEPDAGPEHRAELRAQAERSARQAVAFIDATFSAPKSVTVLGVAFERMANDARAAGDQQAAAAWAEHQNAVEEAVLAGSRAGLDYLQDMAGYSRVGKHGGGANRWIDAHQFVVAQFLQHDSRDRDPQLHVHNAILNRTHCADEPWRALDSRAIGIYRAAAGAIAERVMEAHLARALGVRVATRPDGQAREVLGVSQDVMDLFSKRSQAIGPKAEELVRAFRDRFGRQPSPRELHDIAQQATLATRSAKAHDGETVAQRLDRWETETRTTLVGGLAEVAHTVLALRQQADEPETWSQQDVIDRALDAVKESKAAWSRSDLARAISDQLPGHLGVEPERIRELLDGLTDIALTRAQRLTPEHPVEHLPPELRLDNGLSAFSAPGAERWATGDQLAAERVLRAAAVERGAAALTAEEADALIARFAESGTELGVDQARAVRGVLTSGARVETLSAAAGTGKSFVVATIAEAWRSSGRQVFGLATSQNATNVLAEDGVVSRNIASWLATQQRLDTHRAGGGDEAFRLHAGDVVVVDEASMASTTALAEIHHRCRVAEAKLLLVGDPHQLAAIGPGGALTDIAARGISYDLTEVRRFAADWERTASLGLRQGEVAALDDYARHGRLIDAGTPEQAEAAAARAWLADTLAGHDSLLLVPTNAQAARVCASLRAELVRLGHVDETGVELGLQGTVAGVGDLVQARRNGWDLIGWHGNTRAPINRQTYRVTGLREDGGLTVAPIHGRIDGQEQLGEPLHLPAGYVTEHLALGYASTVHAAQGRTVDTGHAVVGPGMDAAGAYVALTRGRETNIAWTVTVPVSSDAPVGQATEVAPRTARAVLSDLLEAAEMERSALAERDQADLQAQSVMRHGDQLIVGIGLATTGRTTATLDRLVAEGTLDPYHRAMLTADEAFWSLEQILRTAELAGHHPDTVLAEAVAHRDFDDARHPARVLHHRIRTTLHGHLTPQISSHADLIPHDVPDRWHTWLQARADDADDRRRVLGEHLAHDPPQWAREALGPVPDDAIARAEWELKAGYAAAYRELADYTNDADPLGFAPPGGLAEKHALWRAAHAALDLPDAGAEEANLTEGKLRLRVHAWEREQLWAPRWVADELDTTHQTAQHHRTNATLWTARADAATDATEAETLRADAARAQAEADALTERAADLDTAHTARGAWYVATAATRDAAVKARAELAIRGISLEDPDERVTAEEWLAAHRADQLAEDPHREIRDETELADADSAELAPAELAPDADGLETARPDICQVSVAGATEHADPTERHRVPTIDETADAVARAQAALAEIQARREFDEAQAAEEHRLQELARWAEEDHAAQANEQARDDDYALER